MRKEALNAVERVFNYCEEIDLHLPKEEQSGYKMLNDIRLIRGYILENPNDARWRVHDAHSNIYGAKKIECSNCGEIVMVRHIEDEWFCRHCGADMRGE